ncbi:hypothetical protein [Peterkaempfera sp. SMS 1(5)a]|uniref:hypothetical protein n=1 Tax=Peterkaempfera podocarpi TaxID=3232308 RepID=UPI003672CF17
MRIHCIEPARTLSAHRAILHHPRLNGLAVRLLLCALTRPQSTGETLETIAARMPEGRAALATARRQITAEGFYHLRRRQNPQTGAWTTETMVTDAPLLDPGAVETAWAASRPGSGRHDNAPPTAGNPSVGEAGGRDPGASPQGVTTGGKTLPPPPPPATPPPATPPPAPPTPPAGRATPEAAAEAPAAAASGAAPDTRLGEAARLLLRAVESQPLLRIGVAEALRLAPLVAEWLARGVSFGELRLTLISGLPKVVHSAAALLKNRLERKLPPRPDPAPPPPVRHECPECAVPVAQPGVCRACTGLPPTGTVPHRPAPEIAVSGAARVRSQLRHGAPTPTTRRGRR